MVASDRMSAFADAYRGGQSLGGARQAAAFAGSGGQFWNLPEADRLAQVDAGIRARDRQRQLQSAQATAYSSAISGQAGRINPLAAARAGRLASERIGAAAARESAQAGARDQARERFAYAARAAARPDVVRQGIGQALGVGGQLLGFSLGGPLGGMAGGALGSGVGGGVAGGPQFVDRNGDSAHGGPWSMAGADPFWMQPGTARTGRFGGFSGLGEPQIDYTPQAPLTGRAEDMPTSVVLPTETGPRAAGPRAASGMPTTAGGVAGIMSGAQSLPGRQLMPWEMPGYR